MAKLEGQSIAASYDQLLHVDTEGGGNTTTHVSVKDGNNDTTFALTLATDAVMITSTNRLEFGDDGTYINQSGDGILNITSDTEVEINATAVDLNGTLDVSGTSSHGDAVTITKDTDAEFVASILVNQSDAADTTGIISQRFDLEDTGGNAVDSGKILVGKEASFTATGSTQDSYMALHTSLNGTLAEKMRIDSAGDVTFTGDLIMADGKGIDFAADASPASGMTAEILDDYEEGTWTATLTSTTPPDSPPTDTGYYTKIGQLVDVHVRIGDGDTTGGSGGMSITGLPFTVGNVTAIGAIAMYLMDRDTNDTITSWFIQNGTVIKAYETADGAGWSQLSITAGAGKYLQISGSYTV